MHPMTGIVPLILEPSVKGERPVVLAPLWGVMFGRLRSQRALHRGAKRVRFWTAIRGSSAWSVALRRVGRDEVAREMGRIVAGMNCHH